VHSKGNNKEAKKLEIPKRGAVKIKVFEFD